MSIYPPPPPGWDSRKVQTLAEETDPLANERALGVWAHARGYELNTKPDLQWYQGWSPFVYLFKPTRLGREVRAHFGDATVFLVEAFDQVPSDPSENQDCYIVSFLTSPRLAYRAAIRSRMQKEAV